MSQANKPGGPRIVRRSKPLERRKWSWSDFLPKELFNTFRTYFGLGRAAPPEPIDSVPALGRFLDTRSSLIAQTSLYGYLRTRAGMRYPELFDDDEFLVGINIAKWHIWLDCLGDLSVYSGSRIAQLAPRETERIATMVSVLVDEIIVAKGAPEEAGGEFLPHADQVRDRITRTDWLSVGPAEDAFSASPRSVVKWSPVMDELKQLDEEIVLNSVRFRWQEIRRYFAAQLRAEALMASLPPRP